VALGSGIIGTIANISLGFVVMHPDILRIISGFIDGRLKRICSVLLMSSNYVLLAMLLNFFPRSYSALKNLINYRFMGFVLFVTKDSKIRSVELREVPKSYLRNPFVEF